MFHDMDHIEYNRLSSEDVLEKLRYSIEKPIINRILFDFSNNNDDDESSTFIFDSDNLLLESYKILFKKEEDSKKIIEESSSTEVSELAPVELNSTDEDSIRLSAKAYHSYLDENKAYFLDTLFDADFYGWEEPEVVNYVRQNIELNQPCFMSWIEGLYHENHNDEEFLVRLIDLFLWFSYDELAPNVQSLAINIKNLKSTVVQIKILSLLDHWCNKEAFEILNDYEEPQDSWVRIKYEHLKQVIGERCGM